MYKQKVRNEGMGLDYHAVLVNKEGIVEYIRPCGTLKTEQNMIKYWTKGRLKYVWGNSFVAKKPVAFNIGDKVKFRANI